MRPACISLTLLILGCAPQPAFLPELDQEWAHRPSDAQLQACQALTGGPGRVRVDGVKVQSLFEAVAESVPGSVIELSGGVHQAVGLEIPHYLTLRGPCGSKATRVEGDGSDTLLAVGHGVSLTLEGLSLAGGAGRLATDGRRLGGAVHAGRFSTLLLDDVEILHNEASEGAGIYAHANAHVRLVRSRIHDNHGVDAIYEFSRGGGLMMGEQGRLTLDRSTVGRNTAHAGGGIVLLDGGTCDAVDSVVAENRVTDTGGGLMLVGDIGVRGLDIIGNTADRDGGGLWSLSGHLRLVDVRMQDNSAGAEGGAVMADGSLLLLGAVLDGNLAGLNGAALTVTTGPVQIKASKLTHNEVLDATSWAGAVNLLALPLEVVHTDWGAGDNENSPSDVYLAVQGLQVDYAGVNTFVCSSPVGLDDRCQ